MSVPIWHLGVALVMTVEDGANRMTAMIPWFAEAMLATHGPVASARAMQSAIDCCGAGDEYGESFWLWVSDLTALAVRREVSLDDQIPYQSYMN